MPPSSQPWAGPQPHMPKHPTSLLTQRGGSQRTGSFHLSPHGLLTRDGDPEDLSITCSLGRTRRREGQWERGTR